MTVAQSLASLSAYPVPLHVIIDVAQGAGLDHLAEADAAIKRTRAFKIARARLWLWLSEAPDVSQGGQTYSFTDAQREAIRLRATRQLCLYGDEEDAADGPRTTYGYKGSSL